MCPWDTGRGQEMKPSQLCPLLSSAQEGGWKGTAFVVWGLLWLNSTELVAEWSHGYGLTDAGSEVRGLSWG